MSGTNCVQSVQTKLLTLWSETKRSNTTPNPQFSFSSLLLLCVLHQLRRRKSMDGTRKLAHDIFKQLIEINTTDSGGNASAASEAMAQRSATPVLRTPHPDPGPTIARRIWSFDSTERTSINRFCSSVTSMPSKCPPRGLDRRPFTFVEKDGFCTAAARRT